jgi:nitrous oxide reductase
MSEEINSNRRRFLGTAAMTIAATQLGMLSSANAKFSKTKLADLHAIILGRTRRLVR